MKILLAFALMTIAVLLVIETRRWHPITGWESLTHSDLSMLRHPTCRPRRKSLWALLRLLILKRIRRG